MERPMALPWGTRPRARHYYEGFVDKRGPGDQGYRRVWAGLRGLKLAFYRRPQDHEVPGLLRAGSPGRDPRGTPRGWGHPRAGTPQGGTPRTRTFGWDWGGSPRLGPLGSAGVGTPKIGTLPSCPGPGDAPGAGSPQGGTPVPPPQAETVW
ncbi:signal-transducing adaptor protein 2 [Molothrus ater]|uniref:signal-transducing adaptor protein 2 n=1 Tax=Molothrus ater TaxID=84834 RepID=UPI0023E7E0C7|nr:signal-transducing adaptor protein 2 [Molothrus ater]